MLDCSLEFWLGALADVEVDWFFFHTHAHKHQFSAQRRVYTVFLSFITSYRHQKDSYVEPYVFVSSHATSRILNVRLSLCCFCTSFRFLVHGQTEAAAKSCLCTSCPPPILLHHDVVSIQLTLFLLRTMSLESSISWRSNSWNFSSEFL